MIFVVGGLNTDITGRPAGGSLRLHDSNIAQIRVDVGGVGRNMAGNLARLGFETELVAPLGNDYFAAMQEQSCRELHIGLSYAPRFPMGGGVYLCVNDGTGEMFVAMSHMAICDALRPEHIPMEAINQSEACILDANIPPSCLAYIAQNASVPLFADPVSVKKAGRLKPVLGCLKAVKPNALEAEALTGESDPLAAARALVALGVGAAFISLGKAGIAYAAEDGAAGICPALPARPVNTTGAGDAASAAICAGFIRGLGVPETAALACRMAARTIESESAVSPELQPL